MLIERKGRGGLGTDKLGYERDEKESKEKERRRYRVERNCTRGRRDMR